MRRSLWVATGVSALVMSGCFGSPEPRRAAATRLAELPAGDYAVQGAQYDDATGVYRVMVLDAPPATRSVLATEDLRLARLPDEAPGNGERAVLTIADDGPVLRVTPGFSLAYTHAVTSEQTDPLTGQRETVVVRQEQGSWAPFAAGMAGSLVAQALFAPHYVYPPMWAPGGMAGMGSYGPSRAAALQSFQAKHGTLPQPARLAAAGAPLRARDPSKVTAGGAGTSRLKTAPVSKPRGIRRR